MMAAGKMQRLSLLCGLLLAAVAVCGLQRSFLTIDARPNSRSQTPLMHQGLPQMPRASSLGTEWTSWAATGVLAVGAAALALKSHRRDESSATMFSKHDKRTFRGKLHAHTFGKYRLRKNKARRIQAIKNGTFDPEKVVQRGQPEPEHPWDLDNILENPIYYAPDYFKEVLYDYWDDVNEKMREKWQDYMGIKGNQRYFKNWTPPGMEPPPAKPEPSPPAPSGSPKTPKSDPPEEKPASKKAAPKAEKKPEPKPEPVEEKAPEPKTEKKPEPKPEPAEEKAPEPKAEKKPEPKPEPVEEKAPEPKAEKKPEPKPEPAEEKAPEPKAEEKKPEPKPEPAEEKAPEPKAEKKPEPKPEPVEEKAPEPKAEKKPEPKPEPAEEKAPEPKAEEKKPEPKPEPVEEKPKAEEKKPETKAEAKSSAAPSAKDVKALRERSKTGILDCKKALAETDGDMEKAMEWLKKKGMAKADKKAGNVAVEGCVASYVHFNNKIAVLVEVNSETDFVANNAIFKEFAADVAMQVAANDDVAYMTVDDVPVEEKEKEKALEMKKEDLEGKPDQIKEKIVAGRLSKKFEEKTLMSQKWLKDDNITVQEAVKQIIAKLGENIVVRRFERLILGEGLEKKDQDFAAGVEKELAKYKTEGEAKEEPPKEEPKAEEKKEEKKKEKKEEKKVVTVTAAQVKELRGRSGAGILDAKKALAECDCDMEKAMEWLKKKGMAKADKKAGNLSVEGVIASYVHFNSKLGVLVEVNSETDFVALNEIFKEFAADVAMQVAAQPDVKFISVDEVPADLKEKEKALEMAKEDLDGKPDNIKEKIVEGRLKKKFEETALLGQKWLKDEDKTVQEVLKEKIAKLGENIVIRRFTRLTLGEGLDKKDADFAAGVEKELAKYRK